MQPWKTERSMDKSHPLPKMTFMTSENHQPEGAARTLGRAPAMAQIPKTNQHEEIVQVQTWGRFQAGPFRAGTPIGSSNIARTVTIPIRPARNPQIRPTTRKCCRRRFGARLAPAFINKRNPLPSSERMTYEVTRYSGRCSRRMPIHFALLAVLLTRTAPGSAGLPST